MNRRPVINKKKKFIGKGLRMQILAWISVLGCFMLISSTFAWYSVVKREADSKTTSVMQPYYLTLLNPSETDGLQLSVGSLMPGQTKQIVFCVSNRDNEDKINMGGSDFDYSMELIYTENLALNYTIYELQATTEGEEGRIAAEDIVKGEMTTTYWKIKGDSLEGENISATRHQEVGVTDEIINRGTYYEYTMNSSNEVFHLSSRTDEGEAGYDSQYFLLEIKWNDAESSNFNNYEKETDMIYLLVKALQPKPTTSDEVQQ